MKIKTIQFGEIEIEKNKIIELTGGIIGFENLKNYILLNSGNPLFLWLISIDSPENVFPLFGIKVLMGDYPAHEKHEAFGIVKLNSEPLKVTVNLKAPIYLDLDKNKGFQRILDDEKFPLDYKLFIDK